MVSVGPIFVDEVDGERFLQLYTALPNREGDDFATHRTLLPKFKNPCTALIITLETHFGRVQIFGDELAFAKYCQKEWPSENVDRVVASIVRNRGLN